MFDEARWLEIIKRPNWYLEFNKFTRKSQTELKADPKALKKLNKQLRIFFEEALRDDLVSLGTSGHKFDDERELVDTVVIHHTSAKPGYKLDFLNAVHLLNIYVPAFSGSPLKRQALWSGHFRDDKQVFWGYHWLMRMDGSFERLLEDDQIGWHAGNWDINKRSIGICLDNDYKIKNPRPKILKQLALHIAEHYPEIQADKIIGHCEVRKGTICPGGHFLDGWKHKLLQYLP